MIIIQATLKHFPELEGVAGLPLQGSIFDAQTEKQGALLIGSPEEVAEKIIRHSNALGNISRLSFQMDNVGLSHKI